MMKKIIVLIVTVFLFAAGCSEDKSSNPEVAQLHKSEYKVKLDEMPEPVGGIEAIQKNIVYPEEARTQGVSGKVIVVAYINDDGNVDKTEVAKSTSPLLDSAAISAVSAVKFIPGRIDGKNIKSKVAIPIVFKLGDDKLSHKFSEEGAQTVEGKNKDYLTSAEVMPEVKGGVNAIMRSIVYPAGAKEKGIEGKVFVLALIDENGKVVSAESMKEADPLLARAAVEAVKKAEFIPGENKGKKVKVQVVIPITFKLK